MRHHKLIAFGVVLLAGLTELAPSIAAPAEPLAVSDAWARATVDGQANGAAFMTLSAAANVKVVGASSPIASTVQIHEMSMSGSTMKMHQIDNIPIKAGETVKLTPASTHVMLFGLKRTLHAGDHFPVSLSIDAGGAAPLTETVDVQVRPLGQN